MPALPDSRKERFAYAVAMGEHTMAAFRASFGTGDLALFHQVANAPEVVGRVSEISSQAANAPETLSNPFVKD